MDQGLRELLDSADDPVNAECDPRLDWSAIFARVAALKSELERIAGRAFKLDDQVQDATFFADLSLQTRPAVSVPASHSSPARAGLLSCVVRPKKELAEAS